MPTGSSILGLKRDLQPVNPSGPRQIAEPVAPSGGGNTAAGILGLSDPAPRVAFRQRGEESRRQYRAKLESVAQTDAELASIERIQNNPDYVNNEDYRNAAQYIVKIEDYKSQVTDPDELAELTSYQNAIWNANKEQIDNQLLPLIGEESYSQLASTVYEEPAGPGWRERAMGVLGEVGSVFSIPQQQAFRIAQAVAAPLTGGSENVGENLLALPGEVAGAVRGGNIVEGAQAAYQSTGQFLEGEVPTGFQERREETSGGDYIELTDILGIDARGPGWDTRLGRIDPAGVANLAADVVLDPLAPLSLGTSTGARVGVRSMTRGAARAIKDVGAESVEGRRLQQILTSVSSTLQNEGVDALNDVQRAYMERWIREEVGRSYAETLGRRGIRPAASTTARMRDSLKGVNDKIKELEQRWGDDWFDNDIVARRTANRVIDMEQGMGGVRYAGRRIGGQGRGPVTRGWRLTDDVVTDPMDELTTGRFANVTQTEFDDWERAISDGRRYAQETGTAPAWLDETIALRDDFLKALDSQVIDRTPGLASMFFEKTSFGQRVEAVLRAVTPRRNVRTAGRMGRGRAALGNIGEGKTSARFMAGTDEWFDEVLTRELNRLHERAKDIQRVFSPTAQKRALREAIQREGNGIVDEESFLRVIDNALSASDTRVRDGYINMLGGQGQRMMRNALKVRDELNDFAARVGQPMSGVPTMPKAVRELDEADPIRVAWQNYIDEFGTSSYVPRIVDSQKLERLQQAFRDLPPNVQRRIKRGELPNVGDILQGGQATRATDTAFLGSLTAGGHQAARDFRPDIQSLYTLNDAFKDNLRKLDDELKAVGFDIDSMGDIYDTNALSGMALRYREEAERIAMANVWDELTVMPGRGGIGSAGYVFRDTTLPEATVRFKKLANRRGLHSNYRPLQLSETGTVAFVDEAIYDALKDTSRIMANKGDLGTFARHANSLGRVWGAGATSLLSAGTGFHVRNMVGNWFNNFLSGVRDPRWYSEAARAQVLGGVVHRRMSKYGMTWDEALQGLRELPNWKPEMEDLARQVRDALDTNTITDLTRLEDLVDAKRLERLGTSEENWVDWIMGMSGSTGWRRNLSNIVGAPVKGGRALASTVENNARMANYMHKTQRLGWSSADAAAEVRKVLFDYSDLTRFEDQLRGMAMRFYTFTRKNLAYQAYVLGHHPGRLAMGQDLVAAVEQAFGNLLYGTGEASERPEGMPAYAQGGQFFGEGYLNLETPLEQAAGTVGVFTAPALGFPEGADQWFKDVNSYFSGPLPSIAVTAMGEAVGRDIYGGYDITGFTGWEQAERWANALFPGYGRTERFFERLGTIPGTDIPLPGARRDYGEHKGEIAGDTWEQVASNMLGVTRIDWSDEKNEQANRRAVFAAIDSVRDALTEAGVELPSWTETGLTWGNPRQVVAALAAAGGELTEDQLVDFFGGTDAYEAITGLSLAGVAAQSETLEEATAAIEQKVLNFKDVFEVQYGREPEPDEVLAWIDATQQFSATELEGAGLEDPDRANLFEVSGYSPNRTQSPEWVLAVFEATERAFGLTPGAYTGSRPLLDTVDRYMMDAVEAGIPVEQAVQIMLEEELSFTDRWNAGHIFPGTIPLERDPYSSLETDEERFDMAENAIRELAVLETYLAVNFSYTMTPEQRNSYAFASQLNVGDQRRATGTRHSTSLPRRPDTASEYERQLNAEMGASVLIDAAQNGVLPPYIPDEPEGYVPGMSGGSILGL